MKPYDHLTSLSQQFPNAWNLVMQYKLNTSNSPKCPIWCFLPMDAWYAVVAHEYKTSNLTMEQVKEASYLAAIGTWRYTQGIYHINETLYQKILHSSSDETIEFMNVYRLPEWSIYIETPGLIWNKHPLYGFWCHLEWNKINNCNEIRILLNTHQLLTMRLPIEDNILNTIIHNRPTSNEFIETNTMARSLSIICRLIYCLCENNVSILSHTGKEPAYPKPVLYKGEFKLFPPQHPTIWYVEQD